MELLLNLLREIKFPAAHGKLEIVFGRFINSGMTAHASSITEYMSTAISNDFTLGSDITQCTSTKISIYQIINLDARKKVKSKIVNKIVTKKS